MNKPRTVRQEGSARACQVSIRHRGRACGVHNAGQPDLGAAFFTRASAASACEPPTSCTTRDLHELPLFERKARLEKLVFALNSNFAHAK
jgi:hypothetical protein